LVFEIDERLEKDVAARESHALRLRSDSANDRPLLLRALPVLDAGGLLERGVVLDLALHLVVVPMKRRHEELDVRQSRGGGLEQGVAARHQGHHERQEPGTPQAHADVVREVAKLELWEHGGDDQHELRAVRVLLAAGHVRADDEVVVAAEDTEETGDVKWLGGGGGKEVNTGARTSAAQLG
jgi:hypothetical protein